MNGKRGRESWHRGNLFRSRLEVKWATFFESLGVSYRYEPKGFRLAEGKIYYTPDFYLPAYQKYVEIKPYTPDQDEILKARLLVAETGCTTFIISGEPWPGEYRMLPVLPGPRTLYRQYRTKAFPQTDPRAIGYGELTHELYMISQGVKKVATRPWRAQWRVIKGRPCTAIRQGEIIRYAREILGKRISVLFDANAPVPMPNILFSAYLAARRVR